MKPGKQNTADRGVDPFLIANDICWKISLAGYDKVSANRNSPCKLTIS